MKWRDTHALLIVLLSFISGCDNEGDRGPTGPAGEAYAGLTDARIQPSVIFSYPSNGSVGPFDTYNEIQFRFNKIMDIHSLRRAITFSSTAGSIVVDTANMTSETGELVMVSGRDTLSTFSGFYWRVGQSYTLTVSTEATDVNGNHLTEPVVMTFTSEPYFRVRSVTPKRNASVNVSTRVKGRLIFNSPIDTSVLSQIALTPTASVTWAVVGMSAVFTSTSRLDVSTEYILSVGPSAHDQFGNALGSPFETRFSTIPFRVSSTVPVNGNIAFNRGAEITFRLTAPVDSGTIRNSLSISPFINGNISLIPRGGLGFSFRPLTPLDSLTEYTFTVSTSLKSVSGRNLISPFIMRFTTTE